MVPRKPATEAPDLSMLPAALAALAARGTPRSYRRGTVLIEEGSAGDTIYLLTAGRVKACSADARGREVVYGVYGPGEYFGEMSLDGGPRSASVITLEATRCVLVTRATLASHIAEHPEFAFELIARVIRRARLATDSARSMALLDAYGRLAQLLNGLSVEQPDATRAITQRTTHGEIAARIGCSREMVSRLMKDLQRGGYLAPRESGGWTLPRPLPPNW